MFWLKWSVLGVSGLFLLAALVLVIGALTSLDWKKRHTASAAELEPLQDISNTTDGLVLIPVGDLKFRARVANLAGTGDAIILLHGFPQSSASWQPLMDAAAARGFRVIAFDQRGYSPGARPRGVAEYGKDKLVDDVFGIADAAGFDHFHLVGHDWGSAVGWSALMANPGRILSWSSLSIAHPLAFGEAVRTDPDQQGRSRYILLFRMSWLPELVLSFNNRQSLRSVMYYLMPEEHVKEYHAVLAEPGALTSVLNWYRAYDRPTPSSWNPEVDKPVLFIWGNRDPAAGRNSVELQEKYIKGPYRNLELDAGHWLLERRTDIVIKNILEHIGSYPDHSR